MVVEGWSILIMLPVETQAHIGRADGQERSSKFSTSSNVVFVICCRRIDVAESFIVSRYLSPCAIVPLMILLPPHSFVFFMFVGSQVCYMRL